MFISKKEECPLKNSTILLCIIHLSYILTAESKCTRFPPEGVSPLFAFGHTVLPKGTKIFSESVTFFGFNKHSATLLLNEFFYSVTDKLTAAVSIPVFSQEPPKGSNGKKTGLGDIFFHTNYQIYGNREPDEFRYRLITRTAIRVPTTTVAQRTPYTYDTTSFFLGLVQDFMTNDWSVYTDFGAMLPTKRHGVKFGDIFFYNLGVGRIKCYDNRLYLTAYAEMNTIYARPNRVNGKLDLTTGETLLLAGPTFRLEYLITTDPFTSILAQLGFQYAVCHRTRIEPENKIRYFLAALLAYIF